MPNDKIKSWIYYFTQKRKNIWTVGKQMCNVVTFILIITSKLCGTFGLWVNLNLMNNSFGTNILNLWKIGEDEDLV